MSARTAILVGMLLALAWLASVWATWQQAHQAGRDSVAAEHLQLLQADTARAGAAAQAAAQAVARVRAATSTVVQEVRHEIQTVPVYRDCVHPAEQLRRINAALGHTDLADAAGGGELPAAASAAGADLRGDHRSAGAAGADLPHVPGSAGAGGAPAVVPAD